MCEKESCAFVWVILKLLSIDLTSTDLKALKSDLDLFGEPEFPIMSYDMPFYENDSNRQLKSQMIMEQTGADEATVSSLLHEWKEENIDIDALLRASGANASTTQTPNPNSPYQADHQVPTFNGSTRRPNALDLTRTVKFEPTSCQEVENQMRTTSPHPSPYKPNSCNGGSVFNYGNGVNRQLPSPVSPNRQATTPVSPYSTHSQQVSPVSPHAANVMHNMATMSPHSVRSNSCSPVPYNMSAVFGRYADSSIDSYMGGYTSSLKRSDKNSENYRAKRERNNIAVRRSREKKKQREIENEMRVQELSDENSKLQTRLDIVLKEMKLLKSLYQNIGVSLPAEAQMKIERELSKISN